MIMGISLFEAFERVGPQIGVPADELHDFAGEDVVGGYHTIRGTAMWPMGSVWAVEGQFLYALVRALQPDRVMEIGTWRGCSATHILSAMEANGKGQLISVDMKRHDEGIDIPHYLKPRWRFIEQEGTAYITSVRPTVDLVFEDTAHTFPVTVALLTAIDYFMKPKVVVSHDACHFAVGQEVCQAWQTVYKDKWSKALIDPSDCGLAWKVYE
jgi:Methyltransferase domain